MQVTSSYTYCIAYLDFMNFGRGYTLRLVKSKLSMIMQDLIFHAKLEEFEQCLGVLDCQYIC